MIIFIILHFIRYFNIPVLCLSKKITFLQKGFAEKKSYRLTAIHGFVKRPAERWNTQRCS